jgi:hypothetical protein
MNPANLYNYDQTLIDAINLCNIFSHAEKYNIALFFRYIEEKDIDYSTVDAYCSIIEILLEEYQLKDYDLQYTPAVVDDNGRIVPYQPLDTIITLDFIKSVENLNANDLECFNRSQHQELLLNFQQATINGMKFQLKYALDTLYHIRTETFIWDVLGIS